MSVDTHYKLSMANNNLIYNAALAGAAGGAKSARWITDPSASAYFPDRNAAMAFAALLDNAIPTDPSMNTSKAELVLILCSAVLQSKAFTANQVVSDMALAIAALYNELSAALEPVAEPSDLPLSAMFWVDPGIADTGNGSATSPFKTIGEAIAAVEAVTLDAPRAILLAAGDYASEVISWNSVGDTETKNRIVFIGFGAQNIGAVTIVGKPVETPSVSLIGIRDIASITITGGQAAVVNVDQTTVTGDVTGNASSNLDILNGTVGGLISGFSSVDGKLSTINGIDGGNSVSLDDCIVDTIFNISTVELVNCNREIISGISEGTHTLINCRIGQLSTFAGSGSYRDCSFNTGVGSLNITGGATFLNCDIASPVIDTDLSPLNLENCRLTAATTIDGNSITIRKTRLTGPVTDTGTLIIDRSSYDAAIKDALAITASAVAIIDVLSGEQSIAYTAAAPLVLTLVPAGHPPGMYAVGCDCILRTAGTAGTVARVYGYSAPTFGATATQSFAVPATSALGRMVPAAANATFYALQYVRSDGVSAITATFTPAGVTGSPIIDIYASAFLMSVA